jgi:hypothetical protein
MRRPPPRTRQNIIAEQHPLEVNGYGQSKEFPMEGRAAVKVVVWFHTMFVAQYLCGNFVQPTIAHFVRGRLNPTISMLS